MGDPSQNDDDQARLILLGASKCAESVESRACLTPSGVCEFISTRNSVLHESRRFLHLHDSWHNSSFRSGSGHTPVYLVHTALTRKLIDVVSVSRRDAPQSDVVHEQGPSREVDRPCPVPRSTCFCRDSVIGQAGRLFVGLNGALDTLGDPGAGDDRKWCSFRMSERNGVTNSRLDYSVAQSLDLSPT